MKSVAIPGIILASLLSVASIFLIYAFQQHIQELRWFGPTKDLPQAYFWLIVFGLNLFVFLGLLVISALAAVTEDLKYFVSIRAMAVVAAVLSAVTIFVPIFMLFLALKAHKFVKERRLSIQGAPIQPS